MARPKIQRKAKIRERVSKSGRANSANYTPPPARKPEGELAMLLGQMRDAEMAAQTQAELGTKIRHKVIQWMRTRRLAGDIPIAVLAASIHRHEVTMIRIERGTSIAKDSTLRKMLAYFGIDWSPTAKLFTSEPKIQRGRAE